VDLELEPVPLAPSKAAPVVQGTPSSVSCSHQAAGGVLRIHLCESNLQAAPWKVVVGLLPSMTATTTMMSPGISRTSVDLNWVPSSMVAKVKGSIAAPYHSSPWLVRASCPSQIFNLWKCRPCFSLEHCRSALQHVRFDIAPCSRLEHSPFHVKSGRESRSPQVRYLICGSAVLASVWSTAAPLSSMFALILNRCRRISSRYINHS